MATETTKTQAKSSTSQKAAQGSETSTAKRTTSKKIDPNTVVTVRNGFQGMLVYISPHTHETFVWNTFGDEQEMELSELKRAKAASKDFFMNNWFMFDEDWIVDYLGVGNYYKNAVNVNDFDAMFQLPADELEAMVSKLSAGQKESAAYRARRLIDQGEIDSNKSIAVLERVLGIALVDKN